MVGKGLIFTSCFAYFLNDEIICKLCLLCFFNIFKYRKEGRKEGRKIKKEKERKNKGRKKEGREGGRKGIPVANKGCRISSEAIDAVQDE